MGAKLPTKDEIFNAAAEIADAGERAAYLQEACGDDSALRSEIEELLDHDRSEDSLLDRSALGVGATIDQPIAEEPGDAIGSYKLLQQIGEGGMGVVFMAEQTEPIHRTVALKIIKPGMDTRQVIARFEAERQAVAMMDHPNIAKVLDAGTTDSGRPYFVMELVKGVPITKYCDEKHLPLRERLDLFVDVCQAVQHAHQKGIIHRDIKPTNVLVAEYDNHAVPKVIDFGIAKAIAQKLTEQTMFTELGQVIGTVEYMSPEQAKLNQLDIDTRSDIYSLGVLLYELLTGSTPFEQKRLREAAFDEVLRIIREEEPPKPSTKLSTSDTLPSIAANRHTEPARLSKDLRGELDWIVMKSLDKDRNRRYETANGLASDIERYLNDEPVAACAPSASYKLRKLVRKYRLPLAVAAGFLSLLLAGTVVSTWQTICATRATQAEHAMREQASKSEAIAIKNAKIAQRQGSRANTYFLNARATFDAMAERLNDPALLRLPEVANLRKHLLTDLLECYQKIVRDDAIDVAAVQEKASALRMVGDIQRMLEDRVLAEKAYRDAISLREPYVAEHPGAWESYQVLATCYAHLGNLLADESRNDEAEAAFRRALGLWFPVAIDHTDSSPVYVTSLRNIHKKLFKLIEDRGQHDSARAVCGQLLAPFEESAAGSPQEAEPQLRLADALYWAAYLFDDTGRTEDGVKLRDRALSLYEKLAAAPVSPAERSRFGFRYHCKAVLLTGRKRQAEAAEACRKAIELNPKNLSAHADLGRILMQQGKLDEAVGAYRKAVEIDPKADGHWVNLGTALRGQKKFDEAAAAFRKAIELDPKDGSRYGHVGRTRSVSPQVAGYTSLGSLLQQQKKLNEAVSLWRELTELDPKLVAAHLGLGSALLEQRKLEEAVAAFKNALAIDPQNAEGHNYVAWLLATSSDARLRDPSAALAMAKKAIELDPKNGAYLNTLGVACYRTGDWKAAIAALEKSMELRKGGDSRDWFFLAMAHWQLGDKDAARELYKRAVQWMEKNAPDNEEMTRFRAEAAELLDVSDQQAQHPSSRPPPGTAASTTPVPSAARASPT